MYKTYLVKDGKIVNKVIASVGLIEYIKEGGLVDVDYVVQSEREYKVGEVFDEEEE